MRKFDEVTRALSEINKLLESHAKYLDNEEQTKLHLIDPILQAAGWDLSDPAIVRREYGVDIQGLKRVDYALFSEDDDSTPVLILEAKKVWGHKTRTDFKQLQDYLLNSRTRYAILTDGKTWTIYDKAGHTNGDVAEIATFSITGSGFETIARVLLLAPTNFCEMRARDNYASARNSESLIEKSDLETGYRESEFPGEHCLLTNYYVDSSQSLELPRMLVFSDGHKAQVSRWKDIPAQVLAWLLVNSRFDVDQLPIMYSPKSQRAIVSIRPSHPDGRRWTQFEDIYGIYLDTKYNNWAHVDNARKILDHAKVNHSEITVFVD